jgi:hypothetical protein
MWFLFVQIGDRGCDYLLDEGWIAEPWLQWMGSMHITLDPSWWVMRPIKTRG